MHTDFTNESPARTGATAGLGIGAIGSGGDIHTIENAGKSKPTSERRLTFADFILLLVSLKCAGISGKSNMLVSLLYSDLQAGRATVENYDDLQEYGQRIRAGRRPLQKLWSQYSAVASDFEGGHVR
jgi:hypothetical protein